MKKYVLEKLNEDSYEYFMISLTYESILDYIEHVENEDVLINSRGIVLIDQLLTTGNNKNRFISCEYENGKFKLYTAKNVMCKDKIKQLSSQILKKEILAIRNSILTDNQKLLILLGESI